MPVTRIAQPQPGYWWISTVRKWLRFVALLGLISSALPSPFAQTTIPFPTPNSLHHHSHLFCTTYASSHLRSPAPLLNSMTTTGSVSLLYIRVRFPEESPEPVPLDEASLDLTNAASLLHSISYGQCNLQWVITPVFTLPKSREDYTFGDSFSELLKDARSAAKANGIDYTQYQLDVVRHTGLPNLAVGSALVGTRGLQLAASGWFILVHEIGHNFGLNHANRWDTSGPELPFGSPPLPSDFKEIPDSSSIPLHPSSALGHPSLTGPGQSFEYGDPWDIMGSGADYFSIPNRVKLGWVNGDTVARVLLSSTNRLHAPDVPMQSPGQFYALRIPAFERELWVEMAPTNELHPHPALVLRWANPESNIGTDLLLPSVDFLQDPFERTLTLGQTFSDPFRNLHITPIQAGISGSERWMDVVTELAGSSSNHPPVITFATVPSSVQPGDTVLLTASATDPDGDALAWRWNFDDGTTSISPLRAEKSWSTPGEYTMQLQVSDRKGGVARVHRVIRVGEPTTGKISGQVTDTTGNPISGVRVHGLAVEGKNRTLRWMITGTDGRYTLTQLVPGIYTNDAFALGFKMDRVPAVQITGQESVTRNYQGTPLTRVEISSPRFLSEGAGLVNVFTISRTGPTTYPLIVPFQLSGSAQPGIHYEDPGISSLVIPSGEQNTTLALKILDVPGVEAWKTLQLRLDIPVQTEQTRADGRTYLRFYPGLDWEQIEGQGFWTLTDPAFIPGSPAVTTLVDDDLSLSIAADDTTTVTLSLRGDPGMVVHVEDSRDLMHWNFLSTQFLTRNGTALVQLSKQAESPRFFRLTLPGP